MLESWVVSADGKLERPTGTVTFLFTDVEGSTSAWDAHPEQMDAALAQHDMIVRRSVRAHGGYVFATAGDSFSVAFPTAGDGVRAALATQRELSSATWPLPITIAVRMGLHTGHANERGGDYFGPAVNRAARLMSAAHGGQVVCSRVTAELARADVDGDVSFLDFGEVRLKDLLEHEHVYGVVAPGLRHEFAPLQTLDRARHNLPVQRTRLIGRDADVARIVKVMHEHRLITLTGVGGCGKTRLALAIAAEVGELFEDGVCFVELASVADGARVAEVVTEALGVRVGSRAHPDERLSAIAAFLARRDLLIVLDNCEHLLDDVAELVDAIMSSGTQCRVLATSREALEVDGEQTHRVSSLATGARDGSAEDESPALELLAERAASMHGGLDVVAADRVSAREICRRLDGLPLAIELAAAQLGHLGPKELLARLDRRFELLVGGRNRRRQRQQTLQAVMDWSWELLRPDEQRLLARLSVFSGGWTLDAAEGVCGVPGVAAGLRSLVAKSLIEPVKAPHGTRYRMLETVRLFAQQKLVDLGGSAEARSAHCAWFVRWVESVPFEERLFSFGFVSRLSADLDNVFAAIDWALDTSNPAPAAQLVASGAGLWLSGIAATDAVQWTLTLLDADLADADRARLLLAGSLASVAAGTHEHISAWARQARDLARGHDDVVEATATVWQVTPLMSLRPEAAPEMLARARALAAGSTWCLGFVAAWEILAAMSAGERINGRVTPQQANQFGGVDSWGWAGAVQAASVGEALAGNRDEALALISALSPIAPARAMFDLLVVVAEAIAGDPLEAHRLCRRAIADVDRFGDVWFHGELVVLLAILHLRTGDPAAALAYLESAKRAAMGFPYWYRIRLDHATLARAAIGEQGAIDRAIARGKALTVEAILDDELRRLVE